MKGSIILKKQIQYLFSIIFVILFILSCKQNNHNTSNTDNNDDKILSLGSIEIQNNNSQYIIAAPHGGYDYYTDDIVNTFIQDQNWNSLIATDYRTTDHPYNVNRPTEGIGLASDEEIHSDEAKIVYDYYLKNFNILDGENSKLYIEIHGNSREESKPYIEIAQIGIDEDTGNLIKGFLNNKLIDAGITDITILWEGDTGFYFYAASVKEYGILQHTSKAMHMEIPYSLRKDQRQKLDSFLEKALPEMVNLYFQ